MDERMNHWWEDKLSFPERVNRWWWSNLDHFIATDWPEKDRNAAIRAAEEFHCERLTRVVYQYESFESDLVDHYANYVDMPLDGDIQTEIETESEIIWEVWIERDDDEQRTIDKYHELEEDQREEAFARNGPTVYEDECEYYSSPEI